MKSKNLVSKLVLSGLVIGLVLVALYQNSFANNKNSSMSEEEYERIRAYRANNDPTMSTEERLQYQLDEFEKIAEEVRKNGIEITEKEIEFEKNTTERTDKDLSMSKEERIQYQLEEFDKIDEELRENGVESTKKDPNSTENKTGSYPTRKGTILVTRDGEFGDIVGHVGIVYLPSQTIESFPNDGVQLRNNTWHNKYDKIYGLSVRVTSKDVDEKASEWCYNQRNKPYNFDSTDVNNTEKFYCSQLIYAGYKAEANIDLNYGGGIVYPMDLINTILTYSIYTKGI